VYFNYVFVPVQSLCYFYGSVLSILILIDRISFFSKKVKDMIKLGAYKTSGIAFAICFVINMPVFFAFRPQASVSMLNATTSVTIYASVPSQFSLTPLGTALTFVIYALRDILIMLILIVLNIASAWILRAHFIKKTKLVRAVTVTANRTNTVAPTATTALTASSNRNSILPVQNVASEGSRANAKREQRVALMAILICIIEVCDHLIIFVCNVYPYFVFNLTAFVLYTLSNFVLPVSALADVFIFFFFNKNFNKACLRYLNISHDA
jgi:hypothetical protein